MKDLTNYEPFFKMYKTGNIVYPNAVARHFGISTNDAYRICEDMREKGIIKTMYMVSCPVCNHTLSTRYYAISSIDNTNEVGCCNCDTEFIPNIENDVMVYYEKK